MRDSSRCVLAIQSKNAAVCEPPSLNFLLSDVRLLDPPCFGIIHLNDHYTENTPINGIFYHDDVSALIEYDSQIDRISKRE